MVLQDLDKELLIGFEREVVCNGYLIFCARDEVPMVLVV